MRQDRIEQKRTRGAMRAQFFSRLIVVGLVLGAAAPAHAGFFERLLGGRLASVEDGEYLAGDKVRFQLQRDGNNFLLRYDGDPEVFVLSSDHTSLGARLLRYDSGETAMRVAGWGALTLYTDWQPNGLPAERVGDAPPLSPSQMSLQDVQFIAAQAAEKFRHERHIRIVFIVDWSVLETNATLRAVASAAMENAAQGLDRFVQEEHARKLVASHVRRVTLATGTKPGLRLQDRTLIVTFNPEQGYSGCASSRAIVHELAGVLSEPKKASLAASR
jgi:hypothetical protein